MTLPLSGESSPPPGPLGLGGGLPDSQANETPAGGQEASFGDALARLVDGQPAAEPPKGATLALFDTALLLEWQLSGWEPPVESADAPASEESRPDGEDTGGDQKPEETAPALTALPAALPDTPVAAGAQTGAPPPALPVESQDPAGIRPDKPAGDGPAGAAQAAAGGLSGQGAAVGARSGPEAAGTGVAAAPPTNLPMPPEAVRAEPVPEPVQPPPAIDQARPSATPPAAAPAAPAVQARRAAEAAAVAFRGESSTVVTGDTAGPAASAAGSAPGNAAADSGAGGTSPDAETPQPATFTSAGRRFAARIEEFVKESDRQPAGGGRIVATDAAAAALPRVAVIAPAAPAAPPAEPTAESFERLVQSIRIQVRQGISEATIRLQPEHLGEVTISIRLDRGAVSAVIKAEAGNVCEWLRGQEDAIRRSLSEQGMQLERFLVQRDGSRERREPPPQQEQAPPPREPGDDTPRFEAAA